MRLLAKLNGWRRLGVVLVAIWWLAVLSYVGTEFVAPAQQRGVFIWSVRMLSKRQAEELWDLLTPGRDTISAATAEAIFEPPLMHNGVLQDMQVFRSRVRSAVPWADKGEIAEILSDRRLRKVRKIRWYSFPLALLLVPAVAWGLAEGGVVVVKWVIRGFQQQS